MPSLKMFTLRSALAVLLACSAPIAHAAIVSVDSATFDGTFSLLTLTSGGNTYSQADLTTGTLSAFAGSDSGNLLVNNGSGAPGAGAPRQALLSDFEVDTGIVSQAFGSTAVTFDFTVPVVNVPGPDLFFFEIAPNAAFLEAFEFVINGVPGTILAGNYGVSLVEIISSDLYQVEDGTADLNELLNNDAIVPPVSTAISDNVFGVGIDLSDHGVALGGTISSFTYGSFAELGGIGTAGDPVLIAGQINSAAIVPEPSTGLLAAMMGGLFGLLLYRRRSC